MTNLDSRTNCDGTVHENEADPVLIEGIRQGVTIARIYNEMTFTLVLGLVTIAFSVGFVAGLLCVGWFS